jgi:hypothetical protein
VYVIRGVSLLSPFLSLASIAGSRECYYRGARAKILLQGPKYYCKGQNITLVCKGQNITARAKIFKGQNITLVCLSPIHQKSKFQVEIVTTTEKQIPDGNREIIPTTEQNRNITFSPFGTEVCR